MSEKEREKLAKEKQKIAEQKAKNKEQINNMKAAKALLKKCYVKVPKGEQTPDTNECLDQAIASIDSSIECRN